jgi:ankyrin repeat protein
VTTGTFDRAVQAVVRGDESGLRALLAAHPDLIRQRSGSAHQATLLHYVAANGVEDELQLSPRNAPAMARLLLAAGAEVDAVAPLGGDPRFTTTLCMTVTSIHPWRAGVQASLVDALVDHGAKVDGIADEGGPLGCALLFGYTQAAERLVLRGARVDNVIYAAGLGRTDVVRRMLATGTGTEKITRRTDDKAGRFSFPVPRDADAREVAMIVAAMHDRLTSLREFLDAGFNVNTAPFRGQTALHFAAYLGNTGVIEELLARGADTSVIETQCNGTPAQWARETGNLEIAERLERSQD